MSIDPKFLLPPISQEPPSVYLYDVPSATPLPQPPLSSSNRISLKGRVEYQLNEKQLQGLKEPYRALLKQPVARLSSLPIGQEEEEAVQLLANLGALITCHDEELALPNHLLAQVILEFTDQESPHPELERLISIAKEIVKKDPPVRERRDYIQLQWLVSSQIIASSLRQIKNFVNYQESFIYMLKKGISKDKPSPYFLSLFIAHITGIKSQIIQEDDNECKKIWLDLLESQTKIYSNFKYNDNLFKIKVNCNKILIEVLKEKKETMSLELRRNLLEEASDILERDIYPNDDVLHESIKAAKEKILLVAEKYEKANKLKPKSFELISSNAYYDALITDAHDRSNNLYPEERELEKRRDYYKTHRNLAIFSKACDKAGISRLDKALFTGQYLIMKPQE